MRAWRPTVINAVQDPYLWLEDVLGERSLAWVNERNANSRATLEAVPAFVGIRDRLSAVLNSRELIPTVSRRGEFFYNFWQDAAHQRGLLRRTTLAQYRLAEPIWETVLDLDLLAKREGENWVLGGISWLEPSYRRVLLSLSRGGADATVVREFDVVDKGFVDGGYFVPEAKTDIRWIDENEVFIGTNFGPGTLSNAGYPLQSRRWRRGQALSEASIVIQGQPEDLTVSTAHDSTPGFERTFVYRHLDFINTEMFLLDGERLQAVDKPKDAGLSFWREWVLISLRSDWAVAGRTWPAGTNLICKADDYLAGGRNFQALFTPTSTRTLSGMSMTASRILLVVQDKVVAKAEAWHFDGKAWLGQAVNAPFPGNLGLTGLHDPHIANDPLAEDYFQSYTGLLSPSTLSLRSAETGHCELLKATPSFFDASGMRAVQRVATSRDGTPVPYFLVSPKGAQADGKNPTLLYGYGGFNQSMTPSYLGTQGVGWLERGGVYVLANIRGGGEFGPTWHEAARGANKQKSYDDFIAVAEDLIASQVTSPRHLGIQGGSNGGLLVSAVMVQRPDLFNAVVCQVPLTDMQRYHLLLAGASWMAEYGNPEDPAQWAYISKYSPYQNVKAGVKYPKVLFTTSTRDDRVHPAHARKLAARMLEQGHELLYYENVEGGHGGAADKQQLADLLALEFSFLWQQLGAA
ncbi:MAG: S9 family peptidase [Ideonella sp.]|nr:S9 family peptidase [Ideonella sp.]